VPEQFLQAFEELADAESHGALATYTVLALAPGVCEEFLFRGVVLGVLSRVWGGGRAVVVAAIVFAAFHLSVYRFPPVLLVGIAAGAVALWSRSLYPAIALHVTYNAIGVTLAHGRLEGVPIGVQVGAALVLALAGLLLLRRPPVRPPAERVETAESRPRTPFSP
jgi:membrane protease YdiL (CAAX protease family)